MRVFPTDKATGVSQGALAATGASAMYVAVVDAGGNQITSFASAGVSAVSVINSPIVQSTSSVSVVSLPAVNIASASAVSVVNAVTVANGVSSISVVNSPVVQSTSSVSVVNTPTVNVLSASAVSVVNTLAVHPVTVSSGTVSASISNIPAVTVNSGTVSASISNNPTVAQGASGAQAWTVAGTMAQGASGAQAWTTSGSVVNSVSVIQATPANLNVTVVQGASGASAWRTKDAKDQGRTIVGIFAEAAATATVDTLYTLTIQKGNAASGTATSVSVTAGKVLRITAMSRSLVLSSTTAVTSRNRIRYNSSGAASITSLPIWSDQIAVESATFAANEGEELAFAFPDGLEFSGTDQFAISHVESASATANLNISLLGYEYTP